MKKVFGLFIVSAFMIIVSLPAMATERPVPVSDSTSNIIDRTAALYLIDEGKKFFNQGKMRDALRKFREAYVRDKYSARAAYWIGRAHYNMNNYGYALKYAKIAESLSQADDGEVFMLLGESYHRQAILDSARMNYDLAEIQLGNAKKRAYDVNQKINEIAFAQSVKNDEPFTEKILVSSKVNSGYDDYGATFSNDGKIVYFISRRPDTKGGNINPDDQRYFEDVYFASWDEDAEDWVEASNDIERLNSDGFDAVSYVSPDGKTIYLTVNTSILDTKSTTQSSDICVSERTKEDRWNTPKPINSKSVNTSFYDGNPTLTADGNTMYFVSGREGEKSLSDIYVVYKDGKNWSEAEKLPMSVNSTGNETTPYITPDGKYLFFSSDSREGLGGYDVYVTENLGDSWSEPKNLGPTFNSVNNDLFFKYYPKMNTALISTYRLQGNKASMDIFQLNLEGWKIP
jgi:Tol biopolymer transport system component